MEVLILLFMLMCMSSDKPPQSSKYDGLKALGCLGVVLLVLISLVCGIFYFGYWWASH
jgi:hypothetical protein